MRSRFQAGFTLIELLLVVSMIGILSMIAIPNFIQLRAKAYDASALSAGRNAQIIMEIGKKLGNEYVTDLQSLLALEKNLTDDPSVTFIFGAINQSGYTFTSQHAKGQREYLFTD